MSNEAPPELEPLNDTLKHAMRRLMGLGRSELTRAARSGREQLQLRQLKRDLDHFWVRLGKTAYHLVEADEIEHPALSKAIARIEALEKEIEALQKS